MHTSHRAASASRSCFLLAAAWAGVALATGCDAQDIGQDEAWSRDDGHSTAFALDVGAEREAFLPAWEKGGSPANWQKASFNVANAYWLARYAQLAYEKSEGDIRATLEHEGAKPHEVWMLENPCTGAAAVYVQMRDHGVLAFRGTEPATWADISTDLASTKRSWRGSGLVHSGFYEQYDSLVTPNCAEANVELMYFLDQLHGPGADNGPLYVTGHSLGGALATMFVADAQTATCGKTAKCRNAPSLDIAALYTFGSPKVGTTKFANEVAWRATGQTSIYRMVHGDDVVTGVPRNLAALETLFTDDYEHLSYENGSEATLQVWFKGEKMSIAAHVTHILDKLQDHDIGGYVADLETQAIAAGAL